MSESRLAACWLIALGLLISGGARVIWALGRAL